MKRKTVIALCSLTALVLAGGGIAYAGLNGGSRVTVVSMENMSSYMDYYSENSLSGTITSDASQNVYIGSTQTVKEIYVEEGDEVKEGDPLISFDVTMTNLSLEMKELDKQGIELNIEKTKRDIQKLKQSGSNAGDSYEDWGDEWYDEEEPEEEEPEEEEENEEDTIVYTDGHAVLDGSVVTGAQWYKGDGTTDAPYIFLVRSDGSVKGSFFSAMAAHGGYFRIEVRQGDTVDGALISAWEQHGENLAGEEFDPEAIYTLDLKNADDTEDEEDPDDENTDDENPDDDNTGGSSGQDGTGDTTGGSGTDSGNTSGGNDGGGSDGGSTGESGADSGSSAGGSDISGGDQGGSGSSDSGNTDAGSAGSQDAGIGETGTGDADVTPSSSTNSYQAKVRKLGVVTVSSVMGSSGDDSDSGSSNSSSSTSSGYSGSDVQTQIKELENEIRNYELDLKEADLEIAALEKEMNNQTVKSSFNGVVKTVSDPDTAASAGTPVIQVTGSEGLYVQGTLSESDLDKIAVGQEMYGYSYENGVSFSAEMKEISPYPADSSSGYSSDSANNSAYPFVAYIADAEGLSNNSWVELTFTAEGAEGNGILVPKAFVRTGDGQYYVMKDDGSGKLMRQNVTISKIVWGYYYQISDGLTYEDSIAFPYGKNVKEGARTVEGDVDDLY